MMARLSVSKPVSIPSAASATVPSGRPSASFQSATGVTLPMPWSSSTCSSRSREPRLQAAITTRFFALRRLATCLTSASKTLTFSAARSAANVRPTRPAASRTGPVSWVAGTMNGVKRTCPGAAMSAFSSSSPR